MNHAIGRTSLWINRWFAPIYRFKKAGDNFYYASLKMPGVAPKDVDLTWTCKDTLIVEAYKKNVVTIGDPEKCEVRLTFPTYYHYMLYPPFGSTLHSIQKEGFHGYIILSYQRNAK